MALLPGVASASITRYAEYQLGEAGSLGTNNRPQDSSGNGRHFTADTNGSSAVTGTSGVFSPGSTAYLDTSSATAESWSGAPLSGLSDNFALGIYVRSSANDTAHQGDIFCTATTGTPLKISLASGGWAASIHNVVWLGTTNGSGFTANTWIHLAVIRSGGVATFYVNGIAQSGTSSATPTTGTALLGSFPGLTNVFDGFLDDARIVTFTAGEPAVNILAALQSPPVPLTTPPLITSEPPDQAVHTGDMVTLAAPAGGAVPMTWRWYAGTTLLSESTTTSTYTISSVTAADTGEYHAVITNSHGSATSRSMTLTVLPPLITLPPATAPNAGQQAMSARKYGMFCHFGINTFQDQQWTDGTASPSTFTPTAVDVEQWVRTAYLSGMTYILVIAKHHDGFCMWPSAYTSYGVASSPVPTDVLQLASAACAKYGIKLAIYYSLWDRNWNSGAMRATSVDLTSEQSAAYLAYMKNQFAELFTNYGPVCELWLDGSWVAPAEDWHLPELYDYVKQLQPNCQIASNITIVNPPASQNAGDAIQYFPSDFRLNDPDLPKFPDPKTFTYGGNTYYLPFEATITLSSQNFWFYDTRETASKSLTTLENWWNTATAQNNLLVLNAAPNRNGVLLTWDIATLTQLAKRLGLEPGGNFPANLATAATATASSVYNNDTAGYGPALATDENPDSRWAAATGTTACWLQLDFGTPTTFSRVIANEYLTRIQSFNLQSWDGSSWQTITTGTTIGESARIDFPAVTTTKLRLNILAASDSPSLWMLKVQTGGTSPPPPDHDGAWTSPTGGVWQIAGLWENSAIASGVDRTARFDTLDLTSDATITLQSPIPIGNLLFGDITPSHDWTLEAINNHALTLATTTGSPAITVTNRTTTISAALAGTNGLTKLGSGTLVLTGVNSYAGNTSVRTGTLLVDGSTTSASAVTVDGGTLGGTGTIHGSVTIAGGGTLAPGHAGIGVLTVSGSLVLQAGATTAMEIGKSGASVSSDRVDGLSGITYGGALTITASGDPLVSGDRFTLFNLSSGSYAGAFANVNLPVLSTGLKWDITSLAVDGCIQVSAVGAAMPVFSPPAGAYPSAQSISITCATSGSVIHYTTDGSLPSASSAVYTSPIQIPANSSVAVTAMASKPDLLDSPVASATYTTNAPAITVQAWYRLGETGSLGSNNKPQDLSGNARHFVNNQNTPSASTSNAGGPLGNSGITSTAALLFGSGQVNGYWNNGYALPLDNSGMELWAKALAGYTDGWIIATGGTGNTLVLGVSSGKYRASVTGGTSWFDDNSTAVSTSQWTHLAVVRSGGSATFYVNGVAHGSSANSPIAGSATHLGVTSGGNSGFKGNIDEVRMFTFAAGTFQTNNLLYRINATPSFAANPLTMSATQDVAFSGTLTATDSDPGETLNYTKLSGPAWLSVTGAGTLGGTPALADVGTNIFTVRVADSFRASATATLVITVLPTNPDANGNGILDSWETAMFGNANPGNNLPAQDPDGDGICNLLEYAFGTDPLHANACPLSTSVETVDGQQYFRLSIPKNPQAANLAYFAESTADLSPGVWTTSQIVEERNTPDRLIVRYNLPMAYTPCRFLRVRVVANP